MTEPLIAICGLPNSGKTTFLAALWHLISARDLETALQYRSLPEGDLAYLNAIAANWRNAKKQSHTPAGTHRRVAMNLANQSGAPARVIFPDLSGEDYQQMWEKRECNEDLANVLKNGNSILFFIHADTIQSPQWVVDITALSRKMGLPVAEGEEVKWHPRLAPTQVQVVDLLQLLRKAPLDRGPRRLILMLSAWDKVAEEGLSPEQFLQQKLPLLAQYLSSNADSWNYQVHGVSAQGGEYEGTEPNAPKLEEAEALRAMDSPSSRIKLVTGAKESHDITEPLVWLMT